MKQLPILLLLFCASAKGQQPTTKDLIGGCWFVPHYAVNNIHFYENGTFEMKDFNDKKREDEKLHGKYTIEGTSLLLMYDDRPKQKAKLVYDKAGKYYTIRVSPPNPKYEVRLYVHGECP